MNISDELLKKYGIPAVEEFEGREGIWASMVLEATDHIPLKIFESFIENMATASVLEMPNVIIGFFKDIKVTYNEVLTARKTAREEINRIEAELAEVTSKQ